MKSNQKSFRIFVALILVALATPWCAEASPPLSSSYMKRISQDFGVYNSDFKGCHTGLDISTSDKNPSVFAVAGGTVVFNSTNSTKYTTAYEKYFNAFVIINHSTHYGYYGHVTSSLRVGDWVDEGETIGVIRDSYTSTGVRNTSNNHLHYSASVGTDWVKKGWGYQTQTGLKQFVNPARYFAPAQLPEIKLTGLGGFEIRSGDATPSGVDGTEFGRIRKHSSKVSVFSIVNTGPGDLKVSSVSHSGSSSFRVSSGLRLNTTYLQPLVIRSGESLPFAIQFTPTSIFSATADFEIRSNDADEAKYFFKVKGSGI